MRTKKYFVVSDIHSFANELKDGLKKSGFKKTDKDHILVICGDIFDRGSQALEVYEYIMSIPKSRRILIKGNHESLYFELLNKKYPEEHDFHNCTVDTFCQIAGCPIVSEDGGEIITMQDYLESGYYISYGMMADTEDIDPEAQACWNKIKAAVKVHPITKWLKSKEWKDYYELDKYIFVHSFIPVNNDDGLPSYYIKDRKQSYKKDWRTNSTNLEWSDSRWGCPWRQYKAGLFKEEENQGKILVCGHWSTSDFYKYLVYDMSGCSDIFCGPGIIAIDGGVHVDKLYNFIHPQNVLVIDENFKAFDGRYNMPLANMTQRPYTAEPIETVADSYWLDPTKDYDDICKCCAHCATPCARQKFEPDIQTVSDFSKVCSKFNKQ